MSLTIQQKLLYARKHKIRGELAEARRLELEAMDELLIQAYESIGVYHCPKCREQLKDIGGFYSCSKCAVSFEKS